tara:strand:+ start:681 stop:782 length:102 start_codon:yes stop_codon:yes gene_type:complete
VNRDKERNVDRDGKEEERERKIEKCKRMGRKGS